MRNRKAVAFTGPSNSGKTTLILKVARKLIHDHGLEVAIIKHDPKDKARFDTPEKIAISLPIQGQRSLLPHPTKRPTLPTNLRLLKRSSRCLVMWT